MGEYRAYILGIEGHRFILAKDFGIDYPNDAAALSAAKQLTDTHDVEVWDGSRLVTRFSPLAEEASSGFPPLAPATPSDCEQTPVGQADSVSSVLELVDCILKANALTQVIE